MYDKELVMSTLLEAARRAAAEANVEHPDDVATSMIFAIEHAAVTLEILYKGGKLNGT